MPTSENDIFDKIKRYDYMKYFNCILKFETVKILQTQFYDIYA